MNVITMPGSSAKKYVILSNADGKVDVIEKGAQTAYKQLPIDMMQCSLQMGSNLIIGSTSKLFLVDLSQDFAILGHIGLSRHIFCLC